jgi:outer membrane receptor protein involved in Fe transport
MKPYDLVNATITLRLAKMGVDVQAYVRNLFDKRYLMRNLNQEHSLGFTSGTPGDPQTYGIAVNYKF